jgi:hypothetical protein
MGLDKLRVMTEGKPKREFFDMMNADFHLPVDERKNVYRFQFRDREEIEALSPANQVRIHTRPSTEPAFFIELNYCAPGGKLPPQTIVECNPNKFENGFCGVCQLLDSIFWLKDALKITRLDFNADIETVSVQYFRDALRYPRKRKSGDIGEWRKRGTETLYVGRSPSLLRVYDKRQEQQHHRIDVSSFPATLTRLEWEMRQGRWNKLPHDDGKDVTRFGDLPNLLAFQPFSKLELLEAPAYDFEQSTPDALQSFFFDALAKKQGAHAAVRILNRKRNFRRDYGEQVVNNEELRNRIEESYLATTRLFFDNKGADVSFLYAHRSETQPDEIAENGVGVDRPAKRTGPVNDSDAKNSYESR